jgi:hypothetical protein
MIFCTLEMANIPILTLKTDNFSLKTRQFQKVTIDTTFNANIHTKLSYLA